MPAMKTKNTPFPPYPELTASSTAASQSAAGLRTPFWEGKRQLLLDTAVTSDL